MRPVGISPLVRSKEGQMYDLKLIYLRLRAIRGRDGSDPA